MPFRFPGGDQRTTVLGATGSGKSTCGLWLLSYARFDKRPWIALDFKREIIFDHVGFPPIQQLKLSDRIPRKPGLYLVSPRPGQDGHLEAFLWRLWAAGNCGLFVDEAALMPDGDAFPALLQQGRSKRIPIISCSQRPVGVARGVFSEANYFCVYRLTDRRDYKIVEGFVPADIGQPLPRYAWHWYDVAENELLAMSAVPRPTAVASRLREVIPHRPTGWHPFGWTSRPTSRDGSRLVH